MTVAVDEPDPHLASRQPNHRPPDNPALTDAGAAVANETPCPA
jgi:hypothetical protein